MKLKTDNAKRIVCITGASGVVGSKIVNLLLQRGYAVRALTRQQSFDKQGVEIVHGSLENEETLNKFLYDADLQDYDPGQHEEAGIIGQPLQVALPCVALPAKDGVAVRALPRRLAEQRAGHWLAQAVAHEIAKVLAHRVAVS